MRNENQLNANSNNKAKNLSDLVKSIRFCFRVAGHILLAMSCTEILLDIYSAISDNFLGNC